MASLTRRQIVPFVLTFVSGCSSGGSGGSVPVDMQGVWTGTWTSTANPGFQGSITLSLDQDANTVVGTASLFDSLCVSEFSEGTVDAQFDEAKRSIAGTIVYSGVGSLTFLASISGDSKRISGTYFVSGAGACNGDVGTVVATRTTPLVDMRGTWNGTWSSTVNPGFEGTITLELSHQDSVTVRGTANLSNSPCISQFSDGHVNAHIDEIQRTITATLVFPGVGSVTFLGDVSGNNAQVTGTYFISGAGACSGDEGTIAAAKAAPLVSTRAAHYLLFVDERLVDDVFVLGRRESD